MAELIAPGGAETNSADFTLVDGASATLNLKPAGADGYVAAEGHARIFLKASDGSYLYMGSLSRAEPVKQVFGPGTFRVTRTGNGGTIGVDKT